MTAQYNAVPPVPACPDEAYGETSTISGSDEFLDSGSQPIAGYNQFSTLADGTCIDYVIKSSDGDNLEWGLALYDAVRDVLVRAIIQYSVSGVGIAIDLPGAGAQLISNGAATLTFADVLGEVSLVNNREQFSVLVEMANAELLKLGKSVEMSAAAVVEADKVVVVAVKEAQIASIYANSQGGRRVVAFRIWDGIQPNPVEINFLSAPRPTFRAQQFPKNITDLVWWFPADRSVVVEGALPLTGRIESNRYFIRAIGNSTELEIEAFKTSLRNLGAQFCSRNDVAVMMGLKNTRLALVVVKAPLPSLVFPATRTAPITTRIASAPITRISYVGPFLRVLGTLGTAFQAGMILSDLSDRVDDDLRVRLVQGRLQHTTNVVTRDEDRLGSENTLYYVPIYQQEPNLARVTLFTPPNPPGGSGPARRLHWPIRTLRGNCPFVDVTLPSTHPFDIDTNRIRRQTVVDEDNDIPADIFMCWPEDYYFNEVDSHSPNVEQHAARLPRLFYLNWHDRTRRNNGLSGSSRVGFDLINTDELNRGNVGLCLNAKTVEANGFIVERSTGPRLANPLYYLYLGTVSRHLGYVMCDIGMRTLWNRYNRLEYNDFEQMIPSVVPMNRRAVQGYRARFSVVRNMSSHVWVDPTDGSSPLPGISGELIGKFSTVAVGPVTAVVKHVSDDVITTRGVDGPQTFQTSAADCVPTNIEWDNIRLPLGSQGPGVHTIGAFQGLPTGVTDCTGKNYGFVNISTGTFYFFPDPPAVAMPAGFPARPPGFSRTGPLTLLGIDYSFPAPDDCLNKTRGFGFRGSC